MNKKYLLALIGFVFSLAISHHANAQAIVYGVTGCGTPPTTIVNGKPAYLTIDLTGTLCTSAVLSGTITATVAGTTSNASSAVATSSTNLSVVSNNYGFNGVTWDQLQVDASKNLKVAGAVTQASGPWTQNVTQFGGTNISTGTGTGGAGIPRVTISNDSAIINNGFATTAAPTYTTSTYNPLSLDLDGNLRVVTATNSTQTIAPTSDAADALSHASTTALGTSLVAKASAGNLYGFNCSAITGGSAGFCIAYNGSSPPGTGALTGANVLDFCFFSSTAQGCSLSRIPMAVNYGTGIVILISTAATPYTYTTGTATGAITADYK